MFFKQQNSELRYAKKVTFAVLLPFLIAFIFALTACSATKGSVVILEKPFGTQFDISFNEWNGQNKCEMSLSNGDTIQLEVICESGTLSLSIQGKNGSEAYKGNNLQSGTFTVTVADTDDYVVQMSGNKATGSLIIKRV